MSTRPVFDTSVGEAFVGYYDKVRGHVRQEVTRRNLLPFLGTGKLSVADVGGGDGRDSEWLANQGHDVTLMEPSIEMLKRAKRRNAGMRIMRGDAARLLEDTGSNHFDLVLSHGVLMYDLKEPQGHLDRLVNLLKTGGILSLLTKGYGGTVGRLRRQGREGELAQLEKTHQTQNNLGELVWAFDETELTGMIRDAGARVVDWAGVRLETDDDNRLVETVNAGELAAIVDHEAELAHDPSLRANGQMLHFIAEKV